ncbi:hypothetical protein ONE63_004122 [Megalurothrips usitatus]|uniref:WW domain-containing oxidoreductase n=1 Tax=Megalurothrips usitatus TaxID=439358 RepID=A0AAV7X5S3_9NEOP|nr:hypothetical protein ONE63_004122 [Megalurothrips usitatus]
MALILPDSDSEDELPPGWEERATLDGSVYYVNHCTKGTQWTHPRTGKKKIVSGEMPFGWEKCVDEDGKVYYKNNETNRVTYTDPRLAFAIEEKEHPGDFRQRFDGSSTALQVLHGRDLSGKVAIVTGANTGIGFETARSLALHGCTVIFACRDASKAEEAMAQVRSERSNLNCEFIPLDLQSLQSVKDFVTTFQQRFSKLDMLILNAGVFSVPFSLTGDGFESAFQVNHLSQFYLTLLLKPQLLEGKTARVIVVSSENHRFSNLDLNSLSELNLSPKVGGGYRGMMTYNNTKLCNVLFAKELAERWYDDSIQVFSLHPGNMISTDIARHWWVYRLAFALVRPFTKSLQQGASTTVYAATAHELSDCTGLYFNNCCRCAPSKSSQDPQMAKLLWDISTDMVKSVMGEGALPK